MSTEGFQQMLEQCWEKLEQLKRQYIKVKEKNSNRENIGSSRRWYDVMGTIYGHKPANKGSVAGLEPAIIHL